MASPELDRLLIERLADMDAGVARLKQLEIMVQKGMNGVAEGWAESSAWTGVYRWPKELSLAPAHWRRGDVWDAWFGLARGYRDQAQEQFWLTRLCGAGTGTIGFRFYKTTQDTAWRKLLQTQAGRIPRPFFAEESGAFFLEIKVDQAAMADAVASGDMTDVLHPLRQAMDDLKPAAEVFSQLLVAAKPSSRRKA